MTGVPQQRKLFWTFSLLHPMNVWGGASRLESINASCFSLDIVRPVYSCHERYAFIGVPQKDSKSNCVKNTVVSSSILTHLYLDRLLSSVSRLKISFLYLVSL